MTGGVPGSVDGGHQPGEFEVQGGSGDRPGELIDQQSCLGRIRVEREALDGREALVVGDADRQGAGHLEMTQRVIEMGVHGGQIDGFQGVAPNGVGTWHADPPTAQWCSSEASARQTVARSRL
jgi:hypothetical protein